MCRLRQLALELCSGGSVSGLLQRRGRLDLDIARWFTANIVSALRSELRPLLTATTLLSETGESSVQHSRHSLIKNGCHPCLGCSFQQDCSRV